MKTYFDIHLCPLLRDLTSTERLIRKSSELGYSALGITFTPAVDRREIEQIGAICDAAKIRYVTRVDLRPRTVRELLEYLRRVRRRFVIVAVQCYSKAVARQAAKDKRVDLLSFPFNGSGKCFFDRAEAELASSAGASLEIDMSQILSTSGLQRSILLMKLRREVFYAKKFNVPIVLASGTSNVNLLRKPEDYASLAFLFGLSWHDAIKALSSNPQTIVERNARKLGPNYVAPGVYIIKRGEDCRGK